MALDKRLNAFRPDLANQELQGKVEAKCFVEGAPARVTSHFSDILAEPDHTSGLQSQILHGHSVQIFERKAGWAWIQREGDGYVGYVRDETLIGNTATPTHIVCVPRTFVYPTADLKAPRSGYRSMGSKLVIVDKTTTRGTEYFELADGSFVIASHLMKIGDWKEDYVSVAQTLLHTPYLWGGDTGFGIDCSGLVFLSMMLCGKTVLRDSDMQAESIGSKLDTDFTDLQRGDLIFWKGHVGILEDQNTLLHANGHTMDVARENLAEAIARIGYLYGQPTQARRP